MEQNQVQGLYDIYDLIYTPWWQRTSFKVALALVCLSAVIILVAWYIAHKKRRELSPWEKAIAALQALELGGAKQRGRAVYASLTGILKNYLEQRYQVSLADKTDEEMVRFLAESSLPTEIREKAQALFAQAVTRKFGTEEVGGERMVQDIQQARVVVEQTKPDEKKKDQR